MLKELLATLGLLGDDQSQKLGIQRPGGCALVVEVGTSVPWFVRDDEQFQIEAKQMQEAIKIATDRFVKFGKPIEKRTTRAHNRAIIADLASQRLSSRELSRQCESELAMAVEVHRRRQAVKQLVWVQAQVTATSDKKLKRQANAAIRTAKAA